MQDPLADSLPSGDRHFGKATAIKLGESSPRTHFRIFPTASCSGAQKQELFLSGLTLWDTSSFKPMFMASVSVQAAFWLMLFVVRNDGSGFTSSAQAESGLSTMYRFDVQAESVPGTPAMDAACPWCMLCPGNTARECCCSFNCNLGEDLYFCSWKPPLCVLAIYLPHHEQ